MCALLDNACCSSSRIITPAPSPMTKPPLLASKGRQLAAGLSLKRVSRARILQNPPIATASIHASLPPARRGARFFTCAPELYMHVHCISSGQLTSYHNVGIPMANEVIRITHRMCARGAGCRNAVIGTQQLMLHTHSPSSHVGQRARHQERAEPAANQRRQILPGASQSTCCRF